MKALGEAQAEAFDYEQRMKAPPQTKPARYAAALLEMACQYEDNGGAPILNPFHVDERSLFMADAVWMREKGLWRSWKRYYYDQARDKDPKS